MPTNWLAKPIVPGPRFIRIGRALLVAWLLVSSMPQPIWGADADRSGSGRAFGTVEGSMAPQSVAADDLLDGEPVGLPPVPDRLIVGFRPGVSQLRQGFISRSFAVEIRSVRPVVLRRPRLASAGESVFAQLAVVRVQRAEDAPRLLASLRAHPEVRYAEPDYRFRLFDAPPTIQPNDYLFSKLWSLQNTGQEDGNPGADIRATEAWVHATGSRAVKVAVIDTGVDYFHPDLAANVWSNPAEVPGNGIDDDANGYTDDVHGYDFVSDDGDPMDDQFHGTHVAGTIGAVGNNRIGVTGVCWDVTLLALKAFDDRGQGSLSTVIPAIAYAVANGARIINASWGQSDKSSALADAIAAAHAAGVIIVAAAGNDRNDLLVFPAAYPESITVAALNRNDQRAGFSNFGAYVDLAAPGEGVLSTIPDSRYDVFSGTSMAAPHVTGVAALVLGRHPEFTQLDVETILRNSVDELRPDRPLGAGRINAAKAARIHTPLPEARLRVAEVMEGRVEILGTASGPRFASYSLQFGTGNYPTNWTEFHASDLAVTNGVLLAGFSSDALGEGEHAIRLVVRDTLGQEATDRAFVTVQNVHFASPANNDVRRAGDVLELRGNVFGEGRSYVVEHGVGLRPQDWSTNGIHLVDDGQRSVLAGVLGHWDTVGAEPNTFHTLRLSAFRGGQTVGQTLSRMIYLDSTLRPGWPRFFEVAGDYLTNDWRDVKVVDLDADGQAEVVLVDAGTAAGKPAQLVVLGPDGTLRWSRDLGRFEPYYDVPVVGDVDGDGLMEVFADAGEEHAVYGFRSDGSPLGGNWPVRLPGHSLGKALADLDGDGRKELICLTNPDEGYRHLFVLRADGVLLQDWEVSGCERTVDAPKSSPAVGDLDGDGELEIIVPDGCEGVAAFKLSSPGKAFWRARLGGRVVGSPVVADLNRDGRNEVIVCAHDPYPVGRSGTRGGVFVFDQAGKLWPGWPVLIDESLDSTPAVADFDADGVMEIVVANWAGGRLHLLRANGFEPEGWPVDIGGTLSIRSNPVIGDVDGDGKPDVVLAVPGRMRLLVNSGAMDAVGGIMAWRANGQPIDLNPHPDLRSLVMESAGGSQRLKLAPPVLVDLDGDGRLDVVASTVDDVGFSPVEPLSARKHRYSVYAWDLGTPFLPEALPWPTFQHDAQQTGYLPPPFVTNEPPVLAGIPSQTIPVGGKFLIIPLDEYVSDRDDPLKSLAWTIQGQRELRVTVSSRREVTIETPFADWAGSETLHFSVEDRLGRREEAAAVFTARAGYRPPSAATDVVTTLEDTPAELSPLANDTHPGGLPLRIIGLSRPQHGSAQLMAPGVVRYQPAPDYHGSDGFSYTITDGEDGFAQGRVTITVEAVEDVPQAVADAVITDEDLPVAIEVLANDTDGDDDSLELVNYTMPEHGQVVADKEGWLLYTPAENWSGLDAFTYQITDGHGNFAKESVQVLVKPVNDAPEALDQALVLNRNTEVEVFYKASDPDGDEIKFRVGAAPQQGELWTYPKVATYRPKRGFSGTDQFTYVASDGEHDSREATVSFTVTDDNNPPKVEDDSTATRVGRPLAMTLRVTDADDDPTTVELMRLPDHGALTGTGTNYTYQPEPGFVGSDTFRFRAGDGQSTSREATVTIRVTDQNTAPVATEAALTVRMNTATNLVLRGRDSENDPLTFVVVTPPVAGVLSGDSPALVYTPQIGYIGPDRFTFKASDGDLESAAVSVFIEVLQPNHPPMATNQSVTVLPDQPTAIRLGGEDADGDPLQSVIMKGPRGGRVHGLGTNYIYTPRAGFTGSDTFTYKVWDGLAYSGLGVVSINVSLPPPPEPPRIENIDRLESGAVRLSVRVESSRDARLEVSTDLENWITLDSVLPSSQTVVFRDESAIGAGQRFYRVVQ